VTVETRNKNLLTRELKEAGVWNQAISDRYHSGIPDRIAIIDGRAIWLEVKAGEHVELRPTQAVFMKRVLKAGARYLRVYTKGGKLWQEEYGLGDQGVVTRRTSAFNLGSRSTGDNG
jgi:hypothetical protein